MDEKFVTDAALPPPHRYLWGRVVLEAGLAVSKPKPKPKP